VPEFWQGKNKKLNSY